MTDQALADALHTVISLAALIGIAWLYRGLRIDRLRNDLFAMRDEMFLYAAEHQLLDNPGYRELRQIFNAMLRYCHRLSLSQVILASWRARPQSKREAFSEWVATISSLPEEHRDALAAYHIRMLRLGTKFVITGSPIGWVLIVAHWARWLMQKPTEALSQTLLRKWSGGWQTIERQAGQA